MTQANTLCTTHNVPLIDFARETACPVELVEQHLLGKCLVDFVPATRGHPITLVFADGHALPIYCAHCGRALRLVQTEDEFLDRIQGHHIAHVVSAPFEHAAPEMPDAIWLGIEPDSADGRGTKGFPLPVHVRSIAKMLVPIKENE